MYRCDLTIRIQRVVHQLERAEILTTSTDRLHIYGPSVYFLRAMAEMLLKQLKDEKGSHSTYRKVGETK